MGRLQGLLLRLLIQWTMSEDDHHQDPQTGHPTPIKLLLRMLLSDPLQQLNPKIPLETIILEARDIQRFNLPDQVQAVQIWALVVGGVLQYMEPRTLALAVDEVVQHMGNRVLLALKVIGRLIQATLALNFKALRC